MSSAEPSSAEPSSEQPEPWPAQWLRATLSLSVLQIISAGPTYGYAIAGALAEAGFGDIKGGTLYPLLARLTTAELINENWQPGVGGPGRKYYELTSTGRQQLRTQAQQWQTFSSAVATHLSSSTDPTE